MISHSNPPRRHREISFSLSFQYQHSYQKSIYQSPKIAIQQKIQSLSKSKDNHRYESPLRNLHYKYLPNSKKVAQLESESVRQMDQLRKKDENSNKIQNFSEINKRIKKLLVDIEEEENRKQYYCQKYAIEMPESNYQSRSSYQPINNSRDEQQCRRTQFNLNSNYKSKMRGEQQKQNIYGHYFTPTKSNNDRTPNRFNNHGYFQERSLSKSPLTQKKINQNDRCDKPRAEVQKNSNSALKSSVYANLTEKRLKSNKQNTPVIVKGKNVLQQWQRLQNKIQELQKIKRQLQIQVPIKKSDEEPKIVQSHLTQNSSINTFKAKQSSILDIQNYFCQESNESNLVFAQSKNQYHCETITQKQTELWSQITPVSKQEKIIMQDVQLPKILRKITQKKNKVNSQVNQPNSYSFNQFKQSENRVFSKCSNHLIQTDPIKDQYYGWDNKINKIEQEKHLREYEESRLKAANQKNKLLNELKFQIKLDEQLRKAKKWFQKLKISNKWNMLQKQFERNNCRISENQMKTAFLLSSEQQNPFYSPQEGDFTIDELVKIYLAADRHWKYEVSQNYTKKYLLISNFNEENIDISSKGYINIEDLTRYINCQLDLFYRNRDIYLIYHRFRTSQKLYYASILNCLAKQ